ncbi:hypothetical protein AADZ90_016610 [Aestuariibius sp. 2305UL40-4]|uniref:hypothetical protein n=1 Tax=Aestuariibius violaceus TaxID=3234132 RepID=UPI00345E145D
MIFPLSGLFLGALAGAFVARKRGGKRADIAQYALVYAIIFGLAGLFLLILVDRVFYV